MSDRFQCPRYNITLKNLETPESDEGLCDFCWYEYCFCWAEYCLDAWLQAQANSGSPTSNEQATPIHNSK
ncbi:MULTISPECIES: hypothetical protein [unclassified Anabaena]|uniref:hypothetical protein n=1 Tax=unclassified Anabaena TaxID=2619674 RepID=UPI00082D321D|nr:MULTISPECIES: hypothetical protein [unclassified Anabaena]